MLKNIAGQKIGAQMTSVADGLPFTGAVTIYVTGDGGTQVAGSVGTGACVHEGKGLHTYAPAQGETNFDHIAWTFEGTGAITVTVQVYPVAASAGSGARTVTITVNDGTTALQNAIVRMTEGANSYRAITNASGVAVFNLDDATYTVAVTKAGYTYAGTTLVVDGTEAATYSMAVVVVAAPVSPSKTAIEVLCLDADDDPAAGIDIDMRRVVIPTSGTNTAYLGTKVTVASNVSGIARFEVAQGITVEYKRGEADVWHRLTVDSDSVTNVTSFIGSP